MSEIAWAAANSWGLWLCGLVLLAIVFAQAILYIRLSYKTAPEVDMKKADCDRALRAGVISSVGPAIAIFIVMVGTMTLIGPPLAWINTTLVGSVSTDLVGANIGAQVAGAELGTKTYDIMALATSQWTMAINGICFMFFAIVLNPQLAKINKKLGQGDKKWIAILTAAATLGLFAFLLTPHALGSIAKLVAALAAAASMLFFVKFANKKPKYKWLKEWSLGFAMIIGVVFGAVIGL